ncbi:hypothetical protein C8R43DRAFT_1113971 [Mycena crocata]|nr:hypothetical protein C8R43DRAFT_1113971 [Mycena crocata]
MTNSRENVDLPTPTCWHFETNTPIDIPALGFDTKDKHMRRLTHQGRAICRIMNQHGWYLTRLATIFGISPGPISKALRNTYSPPDDLTKDYHVAGAEFSDKYPPPDPVQRPEIPDKAPKTLDEPTVFWPQGGPVEVIEILDSDDELDGLNKEYENQDPLGDQGTYREAMDEIATIYQTHTVIKRSPGPDADLLQADRRSEPISSFNASPWRRGTAYHLYYQSSLTPLQERHLTIRPNPISEFPAMEDKVLLQMIEHQGDRATASTSSQSAPSNLPQKRPLRLEHLLKARERLVASAGSTQSGSSNWQYKRPREVVPENLATKRARYEDGVDSHLANRYTPRRTSTTCSTPGPLSNSDVGYYIPAPPPGFRLSVNGLCLHHPPQECPFILPSRPHPAPWQKTHTLNLMRS